MEEKLERFLEQLMSGSSNYFIDKIPKVRHDAWWQATALTNLLMLEELRRVRIILENLVEDNIIKSKDERKKHKKYGR